MISLAGKKECLIMGKIVSTVKKTSGQFTMQVNTVASSSFSFYCVVDTIDESNFGTYLKSFVQISLASTLKKAAVSHQACKALGHTSRLCKGHGAAHYSARSSHYCKSFLVP